MNTRPPDHELSDHEESQRRYYNRIADRYDSHYGGAWALRYRCEFLERLLDDVDLHGKQVLDACCGGGENSVYLARRQARLTGVDISERQCENYAARFPEADTHCGSIFNAPFDDAAFDFIVVESLHHLHPRVDEAVAALARLLKPGGHLLVWEPCSGSLLDWARKVWYKLDPSFFEPNERSIDFPLLVRTHADRLRLLRLRYGGNLGYLLVHSSMQLRIPTRAVGFYAPLLLRLEWWLERLQPRLAACWGAALLQRT